MGPHASEARQLVLALSQLHLWGRDEGPGVWHVGCRSGREAGGGPGSTRKAPPAPNHPLLPAAAPTPRAGQLATRPPGATCSLPSRVAARWLKMSRMRAVRSHRRTASPSARSRLRSWPGAAGGGPGWRRVGGGRHLGQQPLAERRRQSGICLVQAAAAAGKQQTQPGEPAAAGGPRICRTRAELIVKHDGGGARVRHRRHDFLHLAAADVGARVDLREGKEVGQRRGRAGQCRAGWGGTGRQAGRQAGAWVGRLGDRPTTTSAPKNTHTRAVPTPSSTATVTPPPSPPRPAAGRWIP